MKQPLYDKSYNIIVSKNLQNIYFLSSTHNLKNKEVITEKNLPEKALWKAVIMQAVLDIMNTSKRTEHIVAKRDAISWFNLKNKSFLRVCDNADLKPAWVLKKVRFALENPKTWRRECDLKKFIFTKI